jgi:two-component system C4-dicarboxylate transport sensor histidine kinase DctB
MTATFRLRLAAIAALVAAVSLASWVTGRWFYRATFEAMTYRAQTAADLRVASLKNDIDQYDDLPLVLARDTDLKALLASGAGADSVNRKLEALTQETRAKTIYVIDADGDTIAASNWRTPASFIGLNYSFRPYFAEAMAKGSGAFFGLGTTTGEPGLYIAERVEIAGRGVGVVVVKVQFDALERQWRSADDAVLVVDRHGVVLITTVPDWRFRPLAPLSENVRSELRKSRQVGPDAPLTPLPLRFEGALVNGNEAVAAARAVPESDWRLIAMTPARQDLARAALIGRVMGGLAAILFLGLCAALWGLQRRAKRETARQEHMRRELAERVRERTQELDAANALLVGEVEERRRAQATLERLQDDLFQANKLAVLGRVAAGVAHEINQPLGAIRTFADNAKAFLNRNDAASAKGNLSDISALADRIGAITQELRGFARKSSGEPGPVRVIDAIEGALLLMSARVRSLGVTVERRYPSEPASVIAHRMRLEQVIVNVLQNALDTFDDVEGPMLWIDLEMTAQTVMVTIADNGPGVAPTIAETLFTPFQTSKPQGLGLGLVICRDICREFNGSIALTHSPLGGAAFRITMPRTP